MRRQRPWWTDRKALRAFTLLELMIVVGIMAIVLTTGIPLLYNLNKKEPLRKTLAEIQEVCLNARAQAILKGTPTDLVFHPRERRADIMGAGAAAPRQTESGEVPGLESPGQNLPTSSGRTAIIYPEVDIEMLDINLREYRDQEIGRVRFYPNGTCDEMTLILHFRGQWKKVWLEVTTALVDVGDLRR